MADQPAHMWTYWRDDKGYVTAIEDYYAETVLKDIVLRSAYKRMIDAQNLIDDIFEEMKNKEEEENDIYSF